jgi:hypothetical protein
MESEIARELQRELNGLRPKSRRFFAFETTHSKRKKVQKSQDIQYEIDAYEAYDPTSHHVLINFKGEYPTVEEKYEWQPVVSLLLDYYAKGSWDLVKELENAVISHEKLYVSDNQGYITSRTLVWSLERKPIIDFGHSFDKQTPFIGYLPAFMEGHCMLIYAIHKKDGRKLFGLTDCRSLECALKVRNQTFLLERMHQFIEAKENEIKATCVGHQESLFHSLYAIMGGHVRLSEVKQSSAVNTDALWRYINLKTFKSVSEEDYRTKGPRKARFET